MPTAVQLADFADLMKELARALLGAVRAKVTRPWEQAYLDVRSPPDGSYRDMKLRVIPRNGDPVSVKTTSEVEGVVSRMWAVKDATFSPPWYGLKLVVTQAGECDVNYNYDPQCAEDETFFDD